MAGREDEIMEIVRRARGDDEAFMAGLIELARKDVQDVLDALQVVGTGTASERVMTYEKLAALGRRLAAAAALVAGEEGR